MGEWLIFKVTFWRNLLLHQDALTKKIKNLLQNGSPLSALYYLIGCLLNTFNPFDPNSGETGNTLYGLTEIYNGPEGVQAHMTLGQQREAMFAELVDLTNTYCVAGILGAPVIAAME